MCAMNEEKHQDSVLGAGSGGHDISRGMTV